MNDVTFFDATGYSMWPFLSHGVKLIVKKVAIDALKIGDVVLYRRDQRLVSHRLIKKTKGPEGCLLYIRGDSSTGPPDVVKENMFFGQAVGVVKNNRFIDVTTLKYRIYFRCVVLVAFPLMKGIRFFKKILQKP